MRQARLIRAVFFDLGDTLVVEEDIGNKPLQDVTLNKLPYVDEVLAELDKKGFKLGIITNTTKSREEHIRTALRRIGAERYFDVVITSVDVGHDKPDERIFLTALGKIRAKPQETAMVGNRISTDIIGGNRVGMKTILLEWNRRYPERITSPEEQPTRTIKSLKELPHVIIEI